MSSIEERFIYLMGQIMQTENATTNEDPMRYSKRCAINMARDAVQSGIEQGLRAIRMIDAIDHDSREKKEQESV